MCLCCGYRDPECIPRRGAAPTASEAALEWVNAKPANAPKVYDGRTSARRQGSPPTGQRADSGADLLGCLASPIRRHIERGAYEPASDRGSGRQEARPRRQPIAPAAPGPTKLLESKNFELASALEL